MALLIRNENTRYAGVVAAKWTGRGPSAERGIYTKRWFKEINRTDHEPSTPAMTRMQDFIIKLYGLLKYFIFVSVVLMVIAVGFVFTV